MCFTPIVKKSSPIKRDGNKKYQDLETMGLSTWKSPRPSCSKPGPHKTICALCSKNNLHWCHIKKGGKGSLISSKRRALPLSHEVQSRTPCVLNSLSEKSLGAAGSTPSPRLSQRFMSKG